MAFDSVPWGLAIAVGTQSALGTINATIRDLTGTINADTEGLILGDPESGIGESGIDVKFNREFTENAVLANLTRQPSSFLRQAIEGLTVAFKLSGNRNVLGAVGDADFALDPGIDAILKGFSLTPSAWGGGNGQIYVPGSITYLTVAVWLTAKTGSPFALKWVFQDCIASGSIEFTPAGYGVVTANLEVGSVPAFAGSWTAYEQTVQPVFDYDEQTVSAPVVQGVANIWAETRGFRSLSINFENSIEQLEDSNSLTGLTPRITARDIGIEAELYMDATDLDFEVNELIRTTTPTNALTFTVPNSAPDATPTIIGATARAYKVNVPTPELRSFKPGRAGDVATVEVELAAVAASANAEFELIFL